MNLKSTTKPVCILVGAGDAPDKKIPVREEDYLIAVDGGYDYCREWQLEPDLVLGDFDSVNPARKEELRRRQQENPDTTKVLPVMKDDTDMLAALRIGLEKGYRLFYLYGGCGGRLEHTIANIQCLKFLKSQGAEGHLFSNQERIFIIQNETVHFSANTMGLFSLFALQKAVMGVTIRGMKYPLADAVLTDEYPIGISNEFQGEPAEICITDGTALAIVSRG